jgi:hypothetical protein
MNPLKPIFFAALVFLAGTAMPQSMAPDLKERADSLLNEGNIPGAVEEFRRLYSLYPKDPGIVYRYARVLSMDNAVIRQFDSCFRFLNIAVELDTSLDALLDPGFIPAREDAQWNVFENRLIAMLNMKYKNPWKDIEYAKVLWKLSAYDQAYFDEIGVAMRKLGMRNSVASALWRLKFMIQKKNQEELEKLVTAKDWPRLTNVGSEAVMAAYLVAMHTNDGSQKKYLPMIRQSCEENELPWLRYALIYDRCLFNEKKPQKYGTHTIYNEQSRTENLYPLEDETRVDEWRKEIGLEPLSEYLEKLHIPYQPGKQ